MSIGIKSEQIKNQKDVSEELLEDCNAVDDDESDGLAKNLENLNLNDVKLIHEKKRGQADSSFLNQSINTGME